MNTVILPASGAAPGCSGGQANGEVPSDTGFSKAMQAAAHQGESATPAPHADDGQSEPRAATSTHDKPPAAQDQEGAANDASDSAQGSGSRPAHQPGVSKPGSRLSDRVASDDASREPGARHASKERSVDDDPASAILSIVAPLRNPAFARLAEGANASDPADRAKGHVLDAARAGRGANLTAKVTKTDGKPDHAALPSDALQSLGRQPRQSGRAAARETTAGRDRASAKPATSGKNVGTQPALTIDSALPGSAARAQHADVAGTPAGGNALFGLGAGLHAATPAGTYAAAPVTAVLPQPVASEAWQQQLGQQLVQMVQRGTGRVDLHLNPRELGPLQINLQLHNQTAQVHFLVAHVDVHDAVQQAIPQLREAFAQAGIALGNTQVGQQQQQPSGSFGGHPDSSSWAGHEAEPGATRPVVQRTTTLSSLTAAGGVDLYA